MAFADDHNQICIQHTIGRGGDRGTKRRFARRTSTAITRQNQYHRKKKIRDNFDKQKVLPTRSQKPSPLYVEGQRVEYAREGKLLGLRMTTHGFSRQVTHNRNRAGATLGKLRRFTAFRSRIKLHLYKTLVRPLLEYPAVPLHVAKPTPHQKLKAVQNSGATQPQTLAACSSHLVTAAGRQRSHAPTH